MKSKLLCCTAFALLCVSQIAYADPAPKPGSKNENVSAVKDTVGAAVGVISAEMTSTAQGFVNAASQSDMYEVQAGQIAIARSHSDKIRDFAQEMVKAHTETTTKLKGILATNKVKVTAPPPKLDSRHQSLIDDLKGAKDKDFDVRYLNQQVNAHQEALILMRGYAKDGDNPMLKKFAAETQPAVQMHLDKAKALDKSDEDMKAKK